MSRLYQLGRFLSVSLLSLLAASVMAGLLALPVGLVAMFAALAHFEGPVESQSELSMVAAASVSLMVGGLAFAVAFFVFLAFTLPRTNRFVDWNLLGHRKIDRPEMPNGSGET